MKKILLNIIFILSFVFITGCDNDNQTYASGNVSEISVDDLCYIQIDYYPNHKGCCVDIDFINNKLVFNDYNNLYGGNKEYLLDNCDCIKNFIIDRLFVQEKDKNKYMDTAQEAQATLWDISVYVKNASYSYSSFDEYPDYWKEMWNTIADDAGVNVESEFGVCFS